MARLLVTGGAGFIGTNFVRGWAARHPDDQIVILDSLTYASNRAGADGLCGLHLVQGDIRDTELVQRLLREHQIDTIVHFAAETHVDRSIAGPSVFVETNVAGTHSLLHAARAEWLDRSSGRPHRFHHISTDEIYGSIGPGQPPADEAAAYAPNSPYAASKAASNHLVRAYHQTYGLQTTISACSNNYGPYQHAEKLIPHFLSNCLTGRRLPIYGDGMNVRAWLHVEDHCRGVELALLRGRPGETYNIGGGEELPNLTVIDMLCAIVDRAFAEDASLARRFPAAPPAKGLACATLKSFVEDRLGHDRRYAIDWSKARAELGYRPERRFAEGLEATIRWYLDRPLVAPDQEASIRKISPSKSTM